MEQIITVSREFGSGGRILAEKIGKALNIPVFSKEIIENASKNSGIAIEHFEKSDEKRSGSFLFSLVSTYYAPAAPLELNSAITDDNLFVHISNSVKELAKEPCVMVGRCADDILHQLNPLRIFVCASFEDRLARIMERMNLNEKAAAATIKKADKNRANYYNFYTSKAWGEASNYDICLNTSKLTIDKAADIIINIFN